MKTATRFGAVLAMAFLTAACWSAHAQEKFATPDEAVQALRHAAEAQDTTAFHQIFGPDDKLLLTGDQVQDADNRAKFAHAMAEGCHQVSEGSDKITLEIGAMHWPFPIPLVKADSQWHFDTDAGREEIIDRHIGRDELNAIGLCRAYVDAQREYYNLNPDGSGAAKYAMKFKSDPDTKDGLYWETTSGETASPFAQVVASAHLEGYGSKEGTGHHPFHGYFFKILTRQGRDAPGGKMSYMHHGELTKGFALLAYPQYWGQSGVMTFIINANGKLYQQDLGANTDAMAKSIKEYNPDSKWTLVEDQGVLEH